MGDWSKGGKQLRELNDSGQERAASEMKVFVSKSFDRADREVNSYFERIMQAVGLEIVTAEEFTGETISQRVERKLSECDFLIGIYVVRYEDFQRQKVITSQWVMRETFFAHGKNKEFIALVEDGITDIAGLEMDRELIFFNRNDSASMADATIKFLQALKWYGLIRSGSNV